QSMIATQTTQKPAIQRVRALISMALLISAAGTLGYWFVRAVQADDTEALESPLLLSVARQVVAGPWELYGPFGRENPLVLIHAPLYYRIAALLAWPLYQFGLDVVTAARFAGRALSIIGLFVTLAVAYRLSLLDGSP